MIKKLLYICLSAFGYGQNQDLEAYLLDLNEKFSNVKQLNAEELNQLKNYFIFDTRSEKEYQVSKIPDAEFIDYKKPDFKVFESIDKESTIILYCSVGYRSSVIAEKLTKLGFHKVFNLYGGIFNYVNMGYLVENMDKQVTKKLHAYDKSWGKYIVNTKIIKVYE